MKYISTRGNTEPVGFKDSVLMGLATDGGLLLPYDFPDVTAYLEEWRHLSFQELALEIISLFTEDIPKQDLKKIIDNSYKTFRHNEITPTVKVNDLFILELFHGPTLAFKDVALQFLGNVFSYILEKQGGCLNILGATSGDTGSAAIAGVRGKPNINIFIMHPTGRISPIQEKQMTSVLDDNVFNLGIKGTFDDCQYIMKSIFADLDFKNKYSLGAINSVNWARVLAQIVYYFYSAFSVMKSTGEKKVRFSVPTGNFGNIFAGQMAMMMGLPIEKLLLATNENDILYRYFKHGDYSRKEVISTISPSMDIQSASNYERYRYVSHMCWRSNKYWDELDPNDAKGRSRAFNRHVTNSDKDYYNFIKTGEYATTKDYWDINKFIANRGTTDETLNIIRLYAEKYNYLLDPHTALGVLAAEKNQSDIPTICLATAHPAKFTDTMKVAIGKDVIHPILDGIKDAPTKFDKVSNNIKAVQNFLSDRL